MDGGRGRSTTGRKKKADCRKAGSPCGWCVGPQHFVMQHDSPDKCLFDQKLVSGGNCTHKWQTDRIARRPRLGPRSGTGIVRISSLLAQRLSKMLLKEKKNLLLTSVNTEPVCQVKPDSTVNAEMSFPERAG